MSSISPGGDGPAALHIHHHPLSLNLLAVGVLVGKLHVVLVLVLNECVAARLACNAKTTRFLKGAVV